MKSNYFVMLFSIISMLSSCSKDDDDVEISDRSKALWGRWEYSAILTDKPVDINGDGTMNDDLFNTQEIRQCIKDNLTFFTEMAIAGQGDYSINENGLTCDDNDPYTSIENDRYELIDNSIIRFDNRNDMSIMELTRSKLVIETKDNLGDEDVIVTITFIRG